MTNQEILLLLRAERIVGELSTRQPLSHPVTGLVERWYEIIALLEDHNDSVGAWDSLLRLAEELATLT
jgi:hypothetical protein